MIRSSFRIGFDTDIEMTSGEGVDRQVAGIVGWNGRAGLPVAQVMAFNDVVQHLDTTRVVAIITSRSDGSPIATPIWSVVVDGVPYVRSAFGPGSKWYQHAMGGREVRFAMGDGKVAEQDRAAALAQPSEAVRVELVPTGDGVQQAISDEVASKYSDEPSSVTPMLTEEAIGCTLRVLDAEASAQVLDDAPPDIR